MTNQTKQVAREKRDYYNIGGVVRKSSQ